MGAARDFAVQLQEWAEQNGYLVGYDVAPAAERRPLTVVVPDVEPNDRVAAENLLASKEITAIIYDDDNSAVTVLTAGPLGPRNSKVLPDGHDAIAISWLGSAHIQHNPPPLPAQPPVTQRCYIHNGCIACGSSITAATVFDAGSMGCLLRDSDGELCGLTNNHVTGACNHMLFDMPILSPSPLDASPTGPEPRTIARHKSLVKLDSGNPQAIKPQDYDVAIFRISDPGTVTSMQGPSHYDTPALVSRPVGGMRVKKCGRTTEVTTGTVKGAFLQPIQMPYRSENFNALVYLNNMIGVEGDGGEPFSLGGDSGSLVVSEDGNQAIGLIVGGMTGISIVMPISSLFSDMNWTIESGHNT